MIRSSGMSEDDLFVVAVKRERRHDVPADWLDVVRGTSGVTVIGDSSPLRVQVRASSEAIARISERLADYLHIEKVIPHHPSPRVP
jgi:hypothetical protein